MGTYKPRVLGFEVSKDYEAPDLVRHHPLANADVEILRKVASGLSQAGVTPRRHADEPVAVLEEVSEMFASAIAGAQYEKELNADFYRPEVEALVQDREDAQGDVFANPSLDGVDDYGVQVYAAAPEEKTVAKPVMSKPRSVASLAEPEASAPTPPRPPEKGFAPASEEDNKRYEAILARMNQPISYTD